MEPLLKQAKLPSRIKQHRPEVRKRSLRKTQALVRTDTARIAQSVKIGRFEVLNVKPVFQVSMAKCCVKMGEEVDAAAGFDTKCDSFKVT